MQVEQFNKLITGIEPFTAETAQRLKTIVDAYPSFQLAWLLYLKNLKETESPDFDSVLKLVAIRVSNRKLMYQFLNSKLKELPEIIDYGKVVSPLYNLDGDNEIQSGESLIDKFLQADNGAIRLNNEEDQGGSNEHLKQVAEQSVVENKEIITETLANIYFQQKNYEKAQDAFEKLSLKYPEKSVYFATRIKEIEEIKNK
jgi:tetratricopeptide (TPR) repeat protein